MSDVQLQFAEDPARKLTKNVLSSHMIGIRHEEIPVLDTPTELYIGMNNQPELAISTGVVQDQQARKLPTMEEVIAITTK